MSPYLSRTPPENYVEGRRRVLYSAIFGRPGISFTELQGLTRVRYGNLQYHLETLERAKIVESVKVGRYRRYYPVGMDDFESLRLRAHLADPIYLRTAIDVEASPGVSAGEFHRLHRGLTRQAVAYRIQRLRNAGGIETDQTGNGYRLSERAAAILEEERLAATGNGHCPDYDIDDRGKIGANGSAAGFAPLAVPTAISEPLIARVEVESLA